MMTRFSYVLPMVSLALGVLLLLAVLTLSEGGISATGLLIGAVLTLNGAIRLWARPPLMVPTGLIASGGRRYYNEPASSGSLTPRAP